MNATKREMLLGVGFMTALLKRYDLGRLIQSVM